VSFDCWPLGVVLRGCGLMTVCCALFTLCCGALIIGLTRDTGGVGRFSELFSSAARRDGTGAGPARASLSAVAVCCDVLLAELVAAGAGRGSGRGGGGDGRAVDEIAAAAADGDVV